MCSTSPQATTFIPPLVKVPAGLFKYGTDKTLDTESDDTELAMVELLLDDYQISVTPITNAQYEHFVRDTNYPPPSDWSKIRGLPKNLRCRPVTHVSQIDAFEYCRWLSEKTSRNFTLPSEFEWEKAARGTDGRLYPWGNDWDATLSNCGDPDHIGVTDVGLCPSNASPFGVLDMAGNVFEWTDEGSHQVRIMNLLGDSYSLIAKLRLKNCGTAVGRRWARCASAMEVDPNGLPLTQHLKEGDLGFRVVERP